MSSSEGGNSMPNRYTNPFARASIIILSFTSIFPNLKGASLESMCNSIERFSEVPIFIFLIQSIPPCMEIALSRPLSTISLRNLRMVRKLDFPEAFAPIRTLNLPSSISNSSKLLKLETLILFIHIFSPAHPFSFLQHFYMIYYFYCVEYYIDSGV